MKLSTVMIAAVVSLTAGCATTYMSTQGGTQQDFAQAKYQCMQEAPHGVDVAASGSQNFVVAAVGVAALASAAMTQSYFTSCMAAHGWVPQTK